MRTSWLVRILSCWALAARRHDSASAVGNAHGIVPYAEDQRVTMRVNGNALSGEPEEYVAGKLTVIGRGAAVPGGQLLFEIIRWPEYGQFGWNNSVSGQFVYSPRSYSVMTSNHGVESAEPVPGCKYSCNSCPNAAGANFGPSQPEADPDASDVCDGRLTRCNGFRSTLRDTDFPGQERYVPLASDTQVRWVNGHVCAKASEEDKLEYRRARAEHRLHRMDQSTRERVECKNVPPRRCEMHSAPVPSDMFTFRVRNQFGVSNTATVTVVFERIDRAAMALQFTVLLGVLMFFATCTGLLRVIVLQLLLHPYHQYKCIPAKLGNMFCPVPPPPYMRAREPNDFKPEFMKELASTWPPPGYEGRREATLQRKKQKQSFQLNQDQSVTDQQRGRSLTKRELKAQQADDAMRRSFSRLVSKETRQKGAGAMIVSQAPCLQVCIPCSASAGLAFALLPVVLATVAF